MHILLETLFNIINAPDGDSDENCTSLEIVLTGLKELEAQNTAIVSRVLTQLYFNISPRNHKKAIPTLNSPKHGETALILAAKNGYLRFVCLLLEYGAKPDLRAGNGYTALLWTIYNGHRNCFLALLKAKANPNIPDKMGHTAIWHALFDEDEAYIQALIRSGAELESPNNDGLTLLGEAIKRRKLAPLSLALAYGCLIRNQDLAPLQSLLSRKSLAILYGLPANNLATTLRQLEFCRGVLFEYQDKRNEAEQCYQAATGFAPADRKRADFYKKYGHFLMAALHYHKAIQAGDFFAPGRLAGLLRRHETLTADKIANPAYYLLTTTFLRKAASLMPLAAPLSSHKWRSMADQALANEDFNPLTRIQKTFSFIQRAQETARSQADKRQNKSLLLSTNNLFKQMRENVRRPVELIMEYSENRSLAVKNHLVETFLECRR